MRVLRWLIAVAIATGICWLFPPFHIVSLKTARAKKAATTFNPAAFADTFWNKKLLPALPGAVNAQTLLAAIQADPATAKTNYSHSIGIGGSYYYFLSGTGQVTAVSDDEVSLALIPGSTNTEVSLQASLIFGNALRDGTGLLNVNDYPDSQDFNAISEALNHLAETRVLPKLREQAKVGSKLSFSGCAEVDDESMDLKPLKVVPIQAEAK